MRLLPGLNLTFSLRRATGFTAWRQRLARRTGVPTTRSGLHRKVGRWIMGKVGL